MGFVLAMCVRSIFFLASLGTGGLVATGLFMVAMVAAITYSATHGGWQLGGRVGRNMADDGARRSTARIT
jgi:hypothetical protein